MIFQMMSRELSKENGIVTELEKLFLLMMIQENGAVCIQPQSMGIIL
jgi:hypothetical protein